MAIIVKHTKVSSVPDGADTSLVRPSDWNADHTLTGLGTAAALDAGVANGVATLDSAGKVPVSQMPQMGDLNYQGTWNASTNTPALASSTGTKGYYYVVSVAGSTNLNGITDWTIGDWAVFNGTAWEKIDNTDSVTSVNGYTGAVNLTYTDVGAFPATPTTGTGNVVLQNAPTLSAPLIDGANPYIDFANGSAVTLAAGRMWYDGAVGSFNLGMGNGNITQQVGEEIFVYGKASAAITEGQLICKTGVVGASGQITFAPSPTGLADNDGIIGVATESIALGAFGRITYFGVVHGLDTTGTSVGETWVDGDTLWYNPSYSGGMTKVKPVAPNIKYQIATVIHAGNGGSGSIQVDLQAGSQLGGSDSNVQLTSVANLNLLQYDSTAQYWKNVAASAITGVGSVANALTFNSSGTGDASGSTFNGSAAKTLSYNSIGAQVAGTYVTSVGATAPVTSSGGATPTIAIPAATGSVNGYLTSTDWNAFNSKGNTAYTRTSETATAGQTTFSVTYTVGYIQVYLNGVLLNASDYNASNGTTVILSLAAKVGDILDFVAYTITAIGVPAGSNTQVQFNNSGSLGASSSFTFTGNDLNIPFGTSGSATPTANIALALAMIA